MNLKENRPLLIKTPLVIGTAEPPFHTAKNFRHFCQITMHAYGCTQTRDTTSIWNVRHCLGGAVLSENTILTKSYAVDERNVNLRKKKEATVIFCLIFSKAPTKGKIALLLGLFKAQQRLKTKENRRLKIGLL